MSVIFKSLKMLRDKTSRGRRHEDDVSAPRRFQAFRKLSPAKKIGIVAALLFATGAGALLSLQSIREYIYNKSVKVRLMATSGIAPGKTAKLPPAEVVYDETVGIVKTPRSLSDSSAAKTDEPSSPPPLPQGVVSRTEKPQPERATEPSSLPPPPEGVVMRIEEPKNLPPPRPQISAPETRRETGPSVISPPPTTGPSPRPAGVKEDSIRYIPPSPPPEDKVVVDRTLPTGEGEKSASVGRTIVEPESGGRGVGPSAISPPPGEQSASASSISQPSVPTTGSATVWPPSDGGLPVVKSGRQDDKIASLTLEKAPSPGRAAVEDSGGLREPSSSVTKKPSNNAAIGYLVYKIENSIARGNSAETKKLIDKLGRLKGEDNDYVLKLRAYWNLAEGNNDTASHFLQKVLLRNEDDLEAGINMAILELKTNQAEKGKKRLKKLREIYPDNQTILDLLRKIETQASR